MIAGLSALAGPKHGGSGARVEAMLRSVRDERDVRRVANAICAPRFAARLRRGERLDGFGHPLYAAGNPRAAMLMDMLRERYAASAELRFVVKFETAATALIREKPNLDFALAAVARVLGLPAGSPLMLFAIGRTIGWIGHAIEQYRHRSPDSTAREIRRRAAVDLRRHSRHMSPVIDEGSSDPGPIARARYPARRRDTTATRRVHRQTMEPVVLSFAVMTVEHFDEQRVVRPYPP